MAGRATTPPPQGDVDKSAGLLATTILVTVISIVLTALRFATRIWIVKRVGWDDWTILFACLGHPIGMALVVVQISYGFGRPVYYLTDHEFRIFMKYAYGEWLQTFATLMFTKVSICLFLLRITISKAFIRPLQASIVILIVSNVILTLLWILQCTPHLDKAWNTQMPGKCFGKGQLDHIIITQAVISFVSDYFLSIFPILILRKVQISFRSKVGLCTLMGLGVVTGSLGVARTALNWQNVTPDPTWLVIPNWYIRTWEVIFGLVAACVPTLRPGYKWLMGELHTRYSRHKSSTRKASGQTPLPPSKPSKDAGWSPPKPTAFFDESPNSTRRAKDSKSSRGQWDSSDADSEKLSLRRDEIVSTELELPLQTMDSDSPIFRPVPPPKPAYHEPQRRDVPTQQPSARVATPPRYRHPHIAALQHKDSRSQSSSPSHAHHSSHSQAQPQPHLHSHSHSHSPSHASEPYKQQHPDPNEDQQPHYPRDDNGEPRKEDKAMHVLGDLSTDTKHGMPLRPKRKDEEAMIGGGFGDEELDYRI